MEVGVGDFVRDLFQKRVSHARPARPGVCCLLPPAQGPSYLMRKAVQAQLRPVYRVRPNSAFTPRMNDIEGHPVPATYCSASPHGESHGAVPTHPLRKFQSWMVEGTAIGL